jgi:hypothetical protein
MTEGFFHFRPDNGRTTTIYGLWDGDVLKLSASTCSKSDQFTKKIGRENAKRRMAIGPQMTLHYDAKYTGLGRSRFFVDSATGLGHFFSRFPHALLPLSK